MVRYDELVSGSRFGKFLSVGATGAVVDLAVASTLTLVGPLSPEWAKLVGAECAIVLMFLLNDRWTFADHGTGDVASRVRRLLKSNLVRSGGLAVQFLVVRSLTRIDVSVLGADGWALVTMPIAIGSAALANYVGESLFTWRIASRREPS